MPLRIDISDDHKRGLRPQPLIDPREIHAAYDRLLRYDKLPPLPIILLHRPPLEIHNNYVGVPHLNPKSLPNRVYDGWLQLELKRVSYELVYPLEIACLYNEC